MTTTEKTPRAIEPGDVYSLNHGAGELVFRHWGHEAPEPGDVVTFDGIAYTVTRRSVRTPGGRPTATAYRRTP